VVRYRRRQEVVLASSGGFEEPDEQYHDAVACIVGQWSIEGKLLKYNVIRIFGATGYLDILLTKVILNIMMMPLVFGTRGTVQPEDVCAL